jgi:hypothetical protein
MTTFEHEGKDYELCLTRGGIRVAESQGFVTSDLDQKPTTALGHLFFASLYSRYKIAPKRAVDMLDDLLDDGTFDFTALFVELAEAYNELFGSGESEKETKPTRTKTTEKST